MSGITPAINPRKGIGLAKWLIKHAYAAASAVLNDMYTDGVGQADDPDDLQWRYLTWRIMRTTPTGTEEDYAMFGLNVMNLTGGASDSSWTDADYQTVNAANLELWNTIKQWIAPTHTLVDITYHKKEFHPDLPTGAVVPQYLPAEPGEKPKEVPRFARTGPPLYRQTLNLPGSSIAQGQPYQVAMSVTFRTPGPRHWGRVYLPGLSTAAIGPHARWDTSIAQTVANAFAEYASDLSNGDFYIQVPSTQQEGKYYTALQAVSEIRVDDVPDVIRRRRSREALVKSLGVASP